MSEMSSPFDSLASAVGIQQFFDEFWQKKSGQTCQGFGMVDANWPTIASLDELVLASGNLSDDFFRIVRHDGPINKQLLRRDDGQFDLIGTAELLREGYSLVVNRLHERNVEVSHFCRELENALHSLGVQLDRRIGANLYITGAGAQCFPIHWDNHDVFILQLLGSKHWEVYRPTIPAPLSNSHSDFSEGDVGDAELEQTIGLGDVLYIPRGFPHKALAQDDISIHLTLAMFPLTWTDLINGLTQASPTLREAVPTHNPRAMEIAIEKIQLEMAETLQSPVIMSNLKHRRQESTVRQAALGGTYLLQALEPNGARSKSTVYYRAAGSKTEIHLDSKSNEIAFVFPGTRVVAPVKLRPIFQFIHDNESFTLNELSSLSDDASSVVEELVARGLLSLGKTS